MNKLKKYSKILLLTFFICAFFGVAKSVSADTHYVSKSGSGSVCTQANPCLTIAAGVAAMASGDTLLVGDGIYIERLNNIPNGTPGNYTKIQSQNLHGATIRGSSATNVVNVSYNSYVWVDGFRVDGNNQSGANDAVLYVYFSDHIKITRNAIYGAANADNVVVTTADYSADILYEENWAWGMGRYKFGTYWSNNTLFRRNVARHDYASTTIQCATFNNYDSYNTVWQNNIALDSDPTNQYCSGHFYGAWYHENKNDRTDGVHDTSNTHYGNIAINTGNSTYAAGWFAHMSGVWSIDHLVIYNQEAGLVFDRGNGVASSATFGHMTIGNIYGTEYDYNNGEAGNGVAINHVPGDQGYVTNHTIKNSIFFGAHAYGIGTQIVSDYNSFYANGANTSGSAIGAHSITNVNPQANGLLYLPRIEAGSYLKTAGEGGTQIGAEVVYKMGASGTLYGETGWNTLTSDPLWPFPNEDLIKADFASYAGPGPAGARGFATGLSMDGSPQSLTKYIWEYLGNQIPADIYGSGDITPPGAPSGLSVS